jgi:phytoene dehydrogenase-like protein
MTTAVVVGSGPNGLAAAITLAEAGVSVLVLEAESLPGGGARSSEATLPGLLHDDASGFHPMGVASPFFRGQDLEPYGLRFRWPEIELAHPLEDGRAGLLWRDIGRTVEGFGVDGPRWDATIGWAARRFDALASEILRPILHVPRHPYVLGRFGMMASLPAVAFARLFRTEEAGALFGGVAAHGFGKLTTPFSAAAGVTLGAAGHACGWPVAEGGSQAIADSMLARLADLGAEVRTGVTVTSLDQLGGPDIVMLDTLAGAAARVIGDRLPPRIARAYRRFRPGPAAYKIDLALEGHIPWSNPDVGRAGTVHVGGTVAEMARAEADSNRGRLPERPFILLGQQYLADPQRSSGDLNPIYLYAHVPNGYDGDDATDVMLDHVERYAPGFRSRIRHVTISTPKILSQRNANIDGGDIAGGASDGLQLMFRPRIAVDPYDTKVPGVFLCSASTPPGGAVHGMCGYNAANRALRQLGRTRRFVPPTR